MKLVSHIFDTTADLPANGTSVTAHCGKELIARPINSFAQKTGPIKACKICRQESHQFMILHSNRIVSTLFLFEEVEVEIVK